jgi:hypothetical protein
LMSSSWSLSWPSRREGLISCECDDPMCLGMTCVCDGDERRRGADRMRGLSGGLPLSPCIRHLALAPSARQMVDGGGVTVTSVDHSSAEGSTLRHPPPFAPPSSIRDTCIRVP